MASRRSKPTKNGYSVDVKIAKLDFKTSIQTYQHSKKEADKAAKKIAYRELQVKSGEMDFQTGDYASMPVDERNKAIAHFLLTGEELEAGSVTQPVRLSEAIDDFLDDHRRRGSAYNTVYGYELKLKQVREYFDWKGRGIFIHDISRHMVLEMVDRMRNEKVAGGTRDGQFVNPNKIKERV